MAQTPYLQARLKQKKGNTHVLSALVSYSSFKNKLFCEVWGAGCCIFEALFGEVPWKGAGSSEEVRRSDRFEI